MAMETKMFVSVVLVYYDVSQVTAWLTAVHAKLYMSSMYDLAKVSTTATFHINAFPLAHGISVAPSGLLPSA